MQSVYSVPSVYHQCTIIVQSVYDPFVQSVYTVSLYSHCVQSACSRCTVYHQCTISVPSLYSQCTVTVQSVYGPFVQSVHTVSVYSQCIHSVYTVSVYSQCMYIGPIQSLCIQS